MPDLSSAFRRSAIADPALGLPGLPNLQLSHTLPRELGALARMGAVPTNDSPDSGVFPQTYDTDPQRQAKYLAEQNWRGLSDLALGTGDVVNDYVNAGIRDVNFFAGGEDDPYQFGHPSQDAADLASAFTGAEVIPQESMSPDVRQQGTNQRAVMGMLPVGPESLAPLFKTAVLHAVPNLFKKAALEDLARGVNPDKVWHDWQWEMNAAGQPWTETTGKPTLNESAVKSPTSNEMLPPRTSDFPTDQSAYKPSLQYSLPMDLPERSNYTNKIPMAYDPREPLHPLDPRVTAKHRWQPGNVSDFVDNPQLYNQPGLGFLGDLPMNLRNQPLPDNAGGLYHIPTSSTSGTPQGRIEVTTQGNQVVPITQHELNHAAAQEFGLPQGFNPSASSASNQGAYMRMRLAGDAQAYKDAFDKRTADFWKHEDEMFAKYGDFKPSDFDEATGKHKYRPGEMGLSEFKKQWAKENPLLQKIIDEHKDVEDLLNKTDPSLAYRTSMGEVSARNAAYRDTALKPEQLRNLRPEKTEDVPRKYQWTTEGAR